MKRRLATILVADVVGSGKGRRSRFFSLHPRGRRDHPRRVKQGVKKKTGSVGLCRSLPRRQFVGDDEFQDFGGAAADKGEADIAHAALDRVLHGEAGRCVDPRLPHYYIQHRVKCGMPH